MSAARRLAVAAATLGAAAVVLPLLPARAQIPDWTIDPATLEGVDFVDPARGVLLAGTITPPSSNWIVTDVDVRLTRLETSSACPDVAVTSHLADGHEEVDPTSTTTSAPSTSSTTATTAPEAQPFSVAATPTCNGRYDVILDAYGDLPGSFDDEDTEPDTTFELGTIDVSLPPPDVAGVLVRRERNGSVTVAYQPPTGYGSATACDFAGTDGPPDFLGYAVQRSIDGGDFTTIGATPVGDQCFNDPVAAGTTGAYRYRVLARRQGALGEAVSAGGSTSVGSLQLTPAPPTTAPAPTLPAPAAPPRITPATPAPAPPAEVDEGYSETLDYDEPGEEAAAASDDSFLDFVPSPGAGILVPFAIAECLAVWAMHLRYLARRADEGF